MIHRLFQWRARKSNARTRYKIDRRIYHGRFRAGFVSHLKHAHFWESDRDPALRRSRWKRRFLYAVGFAFGCFLVWVLLVSVGGIAVF